MRGYRYRDSGLTLSEICRRAEAEGRSYGAMVATLEHPVAIYVPEGARRTAPEPDPEELPEPEQEKPRRRCKGRKPAPVPPEVQALIREQLAQGASVYKIAGALRISRAQVYILMRRAGIDPGAERAVYRSRYSEPLQEMLQQGLSVREMAVALGASCATVYNHLGMMGVGREELAAARERRGADV